MLKGHILKLDTSHYGLLVRNDGSREATFAVRKECMKKRSSCSLGQMTSSVAESCCRGREKWSFRVAFPSSEDPCKALVTTYSDPVRGETFSWENWYVHSGDTQAKHLRLKPSSQSADRTHSSSE